MSKSPVTGMFFLFEPVSVPLIGEVFHAYVRTTENTRANIEVSSTNNYEDVLSFS